jgi:hypothetical protein
MSVSVSIPRLQALVYILLDYIMNAERIRRKNGDVFWVSIGCVFLHMLVCCSESSNLGIHSQSTYQTVLEDYTYYTCFD